MSRHPQNSTMLKLFRQQNLGRTLPAETRKQIEEFECQDCAKHAQLPRVPKISIPPDPTPNISVSLDVMSHNINDVKCEILVILDNADSMMRLKKLDDRSALTAFHAFFAKWIAYFDAPRYTVVDRGSNLASQLMSNELRKLNSQLCPIPTESPWSIGGNERSHHFLHRAIGKLTHDAKYQVGHSCEKLLGDLEMAWNLTPHTHGVTPHFLRFGTMPREIGELEEPSSFRQRMALMEIAREEVASARASRVITRALDPYHRNVVRFRHFIVNQKVWFHRRLKGWQVGTVKSIDSPTIMISCDGKQYPTHEHRVRPYFGEISMPPELMNLPETQMTVDKPHTSITDASEISQQEEGTNSESRFPISRLINECFAVTTYSGSNLPSLHQFAMHIDIDDHRTVNIVDVRHGTINSENIFLTQAKVFGAREKMTDEQKAKFLEAKRGEIEFLLSKPVKIVPQSELPDNCELQGLKWVLSLKSSTNTGETRYRARLVSASHRSKLRNSVNGNAPTVALSTVRIALSIAASWRNRQTDDKIVILTRDVTKAYLQSDSSQRLIFYKPPQEFFELFPGNINNIWKAVVQLYGDVEAGRYWNKTLVPWLLNNFPQLRQSVWDPSLLYSPITDMAMLLCTDDMNIIIPESLLPVEANITKRFKCRELQHTPTDFKGVDIAIEGDNVVLSQEEYVNAANPDDAEEKNISKIDLKREMSDDELSNHRKIAGRLAWIATGTSPISAFAASTALQGKRKPVKIMKETAKNLRLAKESSLAKLTYVPIDIDTASIRVYSDGSYQNLIDKRLANWLSHLHRGRA